MSAPAVVEFLYAIQAGQYDGNDDWKPAHVVRFRVTRKTPKRIYYDARQWGPRPMIRFVDRQQIENEGRAIRRSAGWFEPDRELYAELPVIEQAVKPDLAELKARMHAAHPDRGGTDAEFIAARERYERAQRADLARLTELVDATPTTWSTP